MAALYAEFTPGYIYSQKDEACEIENRLVLQIRNLSADTAVSLKNESGAEWQGALPGFDEAEPSPGWSFIYLRFPLGDGNNCLTSHELFAKAQFNTLDTFYCHYLAAGEQSGYEGDTIVLYPAETLDIEPNGQLELVISKLVTNLPLGGTAGVGVKLVNVEPDTVTASALPVYRTVHPLSIRKFELQKSSTVAGFRDNITLQWLILGANSATLTPGDFNVSRTSGEWSTCLTGNTSFMLLARRGGEEVAKTFSIDPTPASILAFSYKRSAAADMLTFHIKVEGTRHVFLSQYGRLKVPETGELDLTIPFAASGKGKYILSVESKNTIEQRTVEVTPV